MSSRNPAQGGPSNMTARAHQSIQGASVSPPLSLGRQPVSLPAPTAPASAALPTPSQSTGYWTNEFESDEDLGDDYDDEKEFVPIVAEEGATAGPTATNTTTTHSSSSSSSSSSSCRPKSTDADNNDDSDDHNNNHAPRLFNNSNYRRSAINSDINDVIDEFAGNDEKAKQFLWDEDMKNLNDPNMSDEERAMRHEAAVLIALPPKRKLFMQETREERKRLRLANLREGQERMKMLDALGEMKKRRAEEREQAEQARKDWLRMHVERELAKLKEEEEDDEEEDGETANADDAMELGEGEAEKEEYDEDEIDDDEEEEIEEENEDDEEIDSDDSDDEDYEDDGDEDDEW
ncbi:hypothetical protein ABEF93_007463 [Exophiala dermatitidis]